MSVLVAVGLDAVLGEPPTRWHPVVWAGRYLDTVGERLPPRPRRSAVVRGGVAWAGGAALSVLLALTVERVASSLPPTLRTAALGAALWPLLSARMLLTEVAAVERALGQDLAGGRAALGRIVSRDPTDLGPDEVRGAALQSLAENLSDSVVAPLFWYAVGGLPAAALHRYANTADASWGYRTSRWEHAGLVAARADDVLNLVPARLTAVLVARPDARLRTEARRTESPNAGWPMAALALELGVQFTKRDHYDLNEDGTSPSSHDVDAGLRRAGRVVLVATALGALAAHGRDRLRGARP